MNLFDVRFYSMSENRLIFLEDSLLTIWDYKTNLWAGWSLESEDGYEQVRASLQLPLQSQD
ncbi:hypothetical protein B0H34DRAFT_715976 [Crassisporium funariophilum]|nr:hypothetical protein B0H34DRAFT_715976 [Crassisporium funariophilum]